MAELQQEAWRPKRVRRAKQKVLNAQGGQRDPYVELRFMNVTTWGPQAQRYFVEQFNRPDGWSSVLAIGIAEQK